MNRHDTLELIRQKSHQMMADCPSCQKPWDLDNTFYWDVNKRLDTIIAKSNAPVRYRKTEQPIYGLGEIDCPPKETFKSPFGYYAILFHEIGHWTADQIDRECVTGRDGYAYEELVADFIAWILLLENNIQGIEDGFFGFDLQEYAKRATKVNNQTLDELIDSVIEDACKAVDWLYSFC